MKMMLAVAALAVLASAPALAAEPASAQSKGKKDPNEVICKMQQTAAGIPQRVCATRKAWDRENERTRQEMMMTQRGFCGGGQAC
jgi:opacity protein-like surface antigen